MHSLSAQKGHHSPHASYATTYAPEKFKTFNGLFKSFLAFQDNENKISKAIEII